MRPLTVYYLFQARLPRCPVLGCQLQLNQAGFVLSQAENVVLATIKSLHFELSVMLLLDGGISPRSCSLSLSWPADARKSSTPKPSHSFSRLQSSGKEERLQIFILDVRHTHAALRQRCWCGLKNWLPFWQMTGKILPGIIVMAISVK